MRTGVAAAAALTVTALLGPVPARAATPRHFLILYGTHSGYVDVTFRSRFRPHVGAYDDPVRPVGESYGPYGGVWIESLAKRGTGPGQVATTPSGGNWHVQFGEPDSGAWQPAGRYRVHFFTEPGSFSVDWYPVDGLARDLVLAPRYDDRVRTKVVTPAAGLPGGRLSDSVTTGAGSLTLALGLVRADKSLARLNLCVASSVQLPCDADPAARRDGPAGATGMPDKVVEVVFVVAMPKTLPNGAHDVGFTVAAVPPSTRMELFTFTLN
jgi:hypothetical protein